MGVPLLLKICKKEKVKKNPLDMGKIRRISNEERLIISTNLTLSRFLMFQMMSPPPGEASAPKVIVIHW